MYYLASLLVLLSFRSFQGICADPFEKELSDNAFSELKDLSVNFLDERNFQLADGCGSLDCGEDSNATCSYSERLMKAFCKCNDWKKRFDYNAKECIDCDCGDSAVDCEIEDKKRKCICRDNYFFNGEKCKECRCGLHSTGCEATDIGDKICFCEPMYKQRFDECLYCDCGYYEGNCSFTLAGEKSCSCEPGFTIDSYKGVCTEMCNTTKPCQNGGTCFKGACKCPKDYTGSWCEAPTWCTNGKCGYETDVECVWNRTEKKGECRCKKNNYYYYPKDKKCNECRCGDHGTCHLVDNIVVCKCDKGYALKNSKCERCNCLSKSDNCTFGPDGNKVCQCQKDYSTKATSWAEVGTWCEICVCGDHGKCRWEGDKKLCDCDDGYRPFEAKCRDCDCGKHGTCSFNQYGDKVCTCDYGFADHWGTCKSCDCNYFSTQRNYDINCTIVSGMKECSCPSGYVKGDFYCEDINECFTTYPCPANTVCINKPGTFDCKCKVGFEEINKVLGARVSGCKDIDECWDFPCQSMLTRCVNSPGSYDCVCKDGYHATSGNYGSSYKPAYNNCYAIETQWRAATIALGVILAIGILWMVIYIKKHKRSS